MNREHALNTFAIGNTTNGKSFGSAFAVTGNDRSGVGLQAMFFAFFDFYFYFDHVTYAKVGDFLV